MNRQSVILDTDIGGDIDDTWALALLLKLDAIDIKLITIVTYDTMYQSKLVAKLLQTVGREDIPIAVKPGMSGWDGPQAGWVKDFDLDKYKGIIRYDIEDAIGEMSEVENIVLLSIGPVTNIANAAKQYPQMGERIKVLGMQGSIHIGYNGDTTPVAETNVRLDVPSCRELYQLFSNLVIFPLDNCGLLRFKGEQYQRILSHNDPLIKAVIENYKNWWLNCDWNEQAQDVDYETSVLFDVAPIMYLVCPDCFVIEQLQLSIDDEGNTIIDKENGTLMDVAIGWKDEAMFYQLLEGAMLRETMKEGL